MKIEFGRVLSPLDTRDFKLQHYIPFELDLSGSKNWDFLSDPLDQGATPHCVGFSIATWGVNLPTQDLYTNEDGHAFYYQCKVLDGEPGAENGSNLRSAAKLMRQLGRIDNYAFAFTVDEIIYWLLNKGPLVVGTDWTEGMMKADQFNVVHPTGSVLGGHAYVLNEITENGMFGIQNSWDAFFGIKGKAYISVSDFETLFRHGGEAIAAVELPLSTAPEKTGCLTELLKLFSIK
jgi:hypothetical protein